MLGRKQKKNISAFINMLWIHYLSACSVQRTTYCGTAICLFMHFLIVLTISWVVDGSHIDIMGVQIYYTDCILNYRREMHMSSVTSPSYPTSYWVHREVSTLSDSTICTYVNGNEVQTEDVVGKIIPLYLCITSADYCHFPSL